MYLNTNDFYPIFTLTKINTIHLTINQLITHEEISFESSQTHDKLRWRRDICCYCRCGWFAKMCRDYNSKKNINI